MADSEKVPEQQQLKHQKQQLNHLDGINGDGGQIQSPADDEPQTPKQIIGKLWDVAQKNCRKDGKQKKKSYPFIFEEKLQVKRRHLRFIIEL